LGKGTADSARQVSASSIFGLGQKKGRGKNRYFWHKCRHDLGKSETKKSTRGEFLAVSYTNPRWRAKAMKRGTKEKKRKGKEREIRLLK